MRASFAPTNPVVVQRKGALPFVLGTVPKAGCSNLRKLALALIAYHPRDSGPRGGHSVPLSMKTIHLSVYPTVWHYEQPAGTLEAGQLPSFLISRNPYQRLVSCYLDKMVQGWKYDRAMYDGINAELRFAPNTTHEPTPEGFATFIQALDRHGKPGWINEHLRLATMVTGDGQWQYEYFLKLQDLPQWLPCLAQGLGIEKWVWDAWRWHPDGGGLELAVPHGGATLPPSQPASCWWTPHQMTCQAFYNATHLEHEPGAGQLSPGADAARGSAMAGSSAVRLRGLHSLPAATADQHLGNARMQNAQALRLFAQTAGIAASQKLRRTGRRFMAVPMPHSAELVEPSLAVAHKLDAHDTGSKRLWRSFYASSPPEIAETVYKLYKPDFDAFGFEEETFAAERWQ